jgi:prevent-host-death family protein
MEHMGEVTTVGIRALKQNASAVVAKAAAGETVIITDRGRPVAQLIPLPSDPIARLIATGRARPARGRIADLPRPEPGPDLSAVLRQMRDDERC